MIIWETIVRSILNRKKNGEVLRQKVCFSKHSFYQSNNFCKAYQRFYDVEIGIKLL